MKKALVKIISVVLVTVLSINFTVSAMAAPSRNTGNVKYLSDIVLIEAENDEKADAIFAELKKEENGGFEAKIALDLNEGGDKKVYLAYKSSTNVDDAITDISVMNMNGDFTVGNYDQLLKDTMDVYLSIAGDYRTMANEFKKNYDANDRNAHIAYRQMNYYYIKENGVKTYMGDYILNFPEDLTSFANMLFKGNLNIISNIRALMSMSLGTPDSTLKDRVNAKYTEAASDPSVYETAAYEEVAKALKNQFEDMKDKINNIPLDIQEINAIDVDAETKTHLINIRQQSLDTSNAFLGLLNDINMGSMKLGDYIMNTAILDEKMFFPLVAAASEGESLMMEYESLYELLLYDVIETENETLDATLAELEKNYEPLSVYYGVQNDLGEGSIGVTGDAEFLASTTGRNFVTETTQTHAPNTGAKVGFYLLGSAGVASMTCGIAYLVTQQSALVTPLKSALANANTKLMEAASSFEANLVGYSAHNGATVNMLSGKIDVGVKEVLEFVDDLPQYTDDFVAASAEVEKAGSNLMNASLSAGQKAFGGLLITLGVVMMGISIWQLVEIYSKYEPTYTEIPDNMVSVISNSTHGDRFINYKNVPSYYYDGNTVKSRENDTNAYDGNQWVSLYYTKNYEAGYCLTTTADLIATETVRNGYSAIHLFSHKSNYNLNSYCNRNSAEPVYLSFKYSTNQKSAVTDVPDVVGSSFNGGLIAVSGFSGFALGLGLMAIVKRKKKPSEEEMEA